jgi:hypothetical protein
MASEGAVSEDVAAAERVPTTAVVLRVMVGEMCEKTSSETRMNVASPENRSATAVLLVHGIGDTQPGELLERSRPEIERIVPPPVDVFELVWNAKVSQAMDGRSLRHQFLLELADGMLTAASVDDVARGLRAATRLTRWSALAGFQVVAPCVALLAAASFWIGWAPAGVGAVLLLLLALIVLALGARLGRSEAVVSVRMIVLTLVWNAMFPAALLALTRWSVLVALGAGALAYQAIPESAQRALEVNIGTEVEPVYMMGCFASFALLVSVGLFALIEAATDAFLASRVRTYVGALGKLAADVMRYIGRPTYRRKLQDHAASELIALASRYDRVVVIAHSLGTVIMTDVLRHLPLDALRDRELVLVTCGSPLRRLFAPFFPSAYPAPVATYRTLKRRFPGLRWVNVYRPRDPVGGALLVPSDVSTNQGHSWLTAHVDYWKDGAAFALGLRALRDCRDVSMVEADAKEERDTIYAPATVRRRRLMLVRQLGLALGLALILVPVSRAVEAAVGPDRVQRILNEGRPVTVRVHHYMFATQRAEGRVDPPEHALRVEFPDGSIRGVPGALVDRRSLVQDFGSQRTGCQLGWRETACRDVQALQLPGRPGEFVVVGYARPPPSGFAHVVMVLHGLGWGVIWALVLWAAWRRVVGRYVALLVGGHPRIQPLINTSTWPVGGAWVIRDLAFLVVGFVLLVAALCGGGG